MNLANMSYKGYKIIHTGHSLGGFNGTTAAKYGHDVVTFDSPGALEYLNSEGIKVSAEMNAVNYRSYPNAVNSYGEKIGVVYKIPIFLTHNTK